LEDDATEKEAKFEETNFIKQVVKIVRWSSGGIAAGVLN
jgi:hypothetical protein